MRASRLALGATLSCALTAGAQVHRVALEWDASEPAEKQAVDACVAAGPDRVIVASNQVLALFERDGDLLESVEVRIPDTTPPIDPRGVTNPDFIFDDDPSVRYIDPRVEYDPYSGRFWLLYLGTNGLHLAISKDSEPDLFGSTDWHIYTGSDRFDPQSLQIGEDFRFDGPADYPVISFDEDYMYLAAADIHFTKACPECPLVNVSATGVLILPRTHDGGTKSILNGERPADSDIQGLQFEKLQEQLQLPNDEIYFKYAVQEPFEDVEGQFYIVTAKGPRFGDPDDPEFGPGAYWDGIHSQIRLGGLYFNSVSGDWEYVFRDMDLPSLADHFFNPRMPVGTGEARPATPAGDSTWVIDTIATKFDSACICRDVNNELKIFAANYVVANNQGEGPLLPVDRHEFRWYVIDPDLSNFPGTSWDPQIEVVGTAPLDGVTGGETYEGAIAVNPDGIAYITFTRSGTGTNGWPSLIRSRLSNNYMTATTMNQFLQAGPDVPYDDGSTNPARQLGTDYCDMQPDYVHCGYWAVGTIAATPPNEPPPPLFTTARAIWVTEIPVNCNGNAAEMDGDGVVNEVDMALYLDYYAKQDQRADMDRSGTITAVDYSIYSGQYAKR